MLVSSCWCRHAGVVIPSDTMSCFSCYDECRYAEWSVFIVMLSVIMLSVFYAKCFVFIAMLCVAMPSFIYAECILLLC